MKNTYRKATVAIVAALVMTLSACGRGGDSGGGNWITVFANSGHAWAYVAGLRWDTGGPGGGNGPRWSTVMRDDASSFVARHPSGY